MPTNVLRYDISKAGPTTGAGKRRGEAVERVVVLTIGRRVLRLGLSDTPTADRIWAALPLFGRAETWGDSVHFEVPVATGRDRTAKLNGVVGEAYFWGEEDRVLIGYGPTPISRPGEMRLPRPCNVWAVALGDPVVLKGVVPGEKIQLARDDAGTTERRR